MNIGVVIAFITALLLWSAPSEAVLNTLSASERQWLEDHPVIRVAYDQYYGPIDMVDEKGRYIGLSADHLDYLSEILGVKFLYGNRGTWSATYSAALAGQFDMLSAVHGFPVRARHFAFSQPYYDNRTAIVTTKANQRTFTSLEQLNGKVVVVVADYALEQLLYEAYPDILYQRVHSISDGLKEVAFGSADAVVGAIAPMTFYMENYGIVNLAVSGVTPFGLDLSFGVRKDWPELVSILDKALAAMPEKEKRAIYSRWIKFDSVLDSRYLGLVHILGALLIAAVLGGLLMWLANRALKKQVGERTLELQELNDSLEALVAERTHTLETVNKHLHASRAALADSNRRLKDMAHFDALTGIANRRTLDKYLERADERLAQYLPMSVILIDVDAFKPYNDHYGHVEGDSCLVKVAQQLSHDLHRRSELVARYGGEEFAILMANCPVEQAASMAERKCQEVANLQIPHASSTVGPYLTVSAGVATLYDTSASMLDLIKRADRALYRAKQAGRNRVVVYE